MQHECSSVCDPSFSNSELPPPTKFSRKAKSGAIPQPVRMPKNSKEFLLAYRAVIARTIMSEESARFYTPPAVLSDEWISELQKMK
jgi:hypothetical protein